jgi:glyoxylase-like metal-dependent hydrolase (beta-lactamase superfamily II)
MLLHQSHDLKIYCFNRCFFRLDGGAMFGIVPKQLWSKLIPSDPENFIKMASRSLLIIESGRSYVVDLGMGDKWTDKQLKIYGLTNLSHPFKDLIPDEIILTHLHLDHCGEISSFKDGQPILNYPSSIIHLQSENLQNAQSPNIRERGSYLDENIIPLKNAKLNLLSGPSKISNHISVHPINGHTRGQQWVKVETPDNIIAFPGDLIRPQLTYHCTMEWDTIFALRPYLRRRKNSLFRPAKRTGKLYFNTIQPLLLVEFILLNTKAPTA